jgi:hypothetical protein
VIGPIRFAFYKVLQEVRTGPPTADETALQRFPSLFWGAGQVLPEAIATEPSYGGCPRTREHMNSIAKYEDPVRLGGRDRW